MLVYVEGDSQVNFLVLLQCVMRVRHLSRTGTRCREAGALLAGEAESDLRPVPPAVPQDTVLCEPWRNALFVLGKHRGLELTLEEPRVRCA